MKAIILSILILFIGTAANADSLSDLRNTITFTDTQFLEYFKKEINTEKNSSATAPEKRMMVEAWKELYLGWKPTSYLPPDSQVVTEAGKYCKEILSSSGEEHQNMLDSYRNGEIYKYKVAIAIRDAARKNNTGNVLQDLVNSTQDIDRALGRDQISPEQKASEHAEYERKYEIQQHNTRVTQQCITACLGVAYSSRMSCQAGCKARSQW